MHALATEQGTCEDARLGPGKGLNGGLVKCYVRSLAKEPPRQPFRVLLRDMEWGFVPFIYSESE